MKPLIKYTGGKYREYPLFKDYIPNKINNYYEPFFGGGGVFFRLKENNLIEGTSYVSDISKDLIDFYRCINKKGFKSEIHRIEKAWNEVHKISDEFCDKYEKAFFEVILKNIPIEAVINDDFKKCLSDRINASKELTGINYHDFSLIDRIYNSIYDKAKRFASKDIKSDDIYVSCKSLETAIHQGFYFTIRDMYNEWLLNPKSKYSIYERSAQWFYIREFCFGSMFRFGPDGKFNIPYGGYVYNSKNFKNKVENLFTKEMNENLKTINFKCCDFEEALLHDYEEDDFIFLDPPYDSTFSEYDNNSFTREDHKRLHDVLTKIKCKWLMVIGKTDFISHLYREFNIIEYDKTYMYQARGEYESKHTSHLIIKNF